MLRIAVCDDEGGHEIPLLSKGEGALGGNAAGRAVPYSFSGH